MHIPKTATTLSVHHEHVTYIDESAVPVPGRNRKLLVQIDTHHSVVDAISIEGPEAAFAIALGILRAYGLTLVCPTCSTPKVPRD